MSIKVLYILQNFYTSPKQFLATPLSIVCMLVDVVQVPEVIPLVVNKSMSQTDVYTISCVAHFAFPPVDLMWVKGKRSEVIHQSAS